MGSVVYLDSEDDDIQLGRDSWGAWNSMSSGSSSRKTLLDMGLHCLMYDWFRGRVSFRRRRCGHDTTHKHILEGRSPLQINMSTACFS